MNTETFTTDRDALDNITQALGEYAEDFDTRAIFDEAFTFDADRQAFVQTVDADEFWTICSRHDISGK